MGNVNSLAVTIPDFLPRVGGLIEMPNLRPGFFKEQFWGLMAERGAATNVADVEMRLAGILNSHGVDRPTAFKVVDAALRAALRDLVIENSQRGVLVALGLRHKGKPKNPMEALDYDRVQINVLAALKSEFAAQLGSLVPGGGQFVTPYMVPAVDQVAN